MSKEIHPFFDLRGRVAMVTGGGSGLGREFCDVLAEFGADVVCVSRHKAHAEETGEIIKKHGHRALTIEADVSRYEQVQTMFKELDSAFGRLDILVNNAGVTTRSALIDQTDVVEWHRVLGVDLSGVFYCMKEGLKLMLRQKKGSIINISSIAGLVADYPDIETISPYVAAKSGVIGLTRQGAAEYGQHNIRVNCICPGWHLGTNIGKSAGRIRTESEALAFRQMLASRAPLKRTAEPKELRGLLLFLASDASSFLTGQIIASDGGWTCW